MSDSNPSRRRFLAHAACAAALAPLGARLLSQPAQAQTLTPLPADNATAVALAYAEDAASVKHPNYKPNSTCANCQFYTGKPEDERGGCTLFPTFSVAGKGWCSAWAVKA
jgi:hypothetical protein